MKRFLLVLIMTFLATLALAQTGLLGLYYGESFYYARKNLEDKGYLLINNQSVIKQFGIDPAPSIYLVDLYVNPSTSTIVGWTLHYNEGLSEDAQRQVLNECISLHGKEYNVMEEENMIGWHLSDTRSMLIGCDKGGNLSVAVYYDDDYTYIFNQGEEQDKYKN